MKNYWLLLCGLALSSASFAGTMGETCVKEGVTLPCESKAWDIGIQALYLQTGFNDLGGNYIGAVQDEGETRTLVDATPDWGWGFNLEGSYHFDAGKDLILSWYHLDNSPTKPSGIQSIWSSVNYRNGAA